MKAVRKRISYTIVSTSWFVNSHFPTWSLAKGQPLPLYAIGEKVRFLLMFLLFSMLASSH